MVKPFQREGLKDPLQVLSRCLDRDTVITHRPSPRHLRRGHFLRAHPALHSAVQWHRLHSGHGRIDYAYWYGRRMGVGRDLDEGGFGYPASA